MNTLTVAENDVIRTISPNETMNREDLSFPDEYWVAGRSALAAIGAGLDAAGKPVSEIRRILDIPCGHGRVLRYLKAAFPDAELTACDLLRDGVDFCSSVFGAIPVYSHEDADKIPLEHSAYDLIWVGSLFTHFDAGQWKALLPRLASSLREGGVLIFSTHGRYVYRRMKGLEDSDSFGLPYWRVTKALYRYERSGFGYGKYWGANNYGISISDPQWVVSTVTSLHALRCAYFAERAWHDLQDVYACVKSLHPTATDTATSLSDYMKHVIREFLSPLRRRIPIAGVAIGFIVLAWLLFSENPSDKKNKKP